MEPIYQQDFEITDVHVDRYGRLKPSMILFFAQEIAGQHCTELALDYETLAQRRLFWAVTRHRVQVTRMPMRGEKLHIETWPMPTTRVAYPRSMVAYDEKGQECFRSISLWVLMDRDTRAMVLPGKSGVEVQGLLRGSELAVPGSMVPREMAEEDRRTVRFTDLDINGHMNNCRYLDWITDLLPSSFYEDHSIREFTVCYLSELREGERLALHWEMRDGPMLQVEAQRCDGAGSTGHSRVFSARIELQDVVL